MEFKSHADAHCNKKPNSAERVPGTALIDTAANPGLNEIST